MSTAQQAQHQHRPTATEHILDSDSFLHKELAKAPLREHDGFLVADISRIPNDLKVLPPDQRESIEKILEKLEEDDDVTQVFHNMKEEDEDPAE